MNKKINLAVIGLGARGYSVIKGVILKMPDVEVVSVCDVYEDRVQKTVSLISERRDIAPQGFTDYRKALSVKNLDAVLIITSWQMHDEIAMYAMEKGIAVGSEVAGAYSIESCFDLVKTQQRTKTPYMLLENCCYGKEELLVTAMVRKGIFGEIVHCSGSYAHDLRPEIAWGIENRHYRYDNYMHRNCENYPTHELGPIAKLLNINRGNRIVSVTSVASKAAGLNEYIKEEAKKREIPEYLKNAKFAQGDIVNTVLTCAGGETILLKLDKTLPRFYSRDFTVRGTKGMYEQATNSIYFPGITEEYFDAVDTYEKIINNAVKYEEEYLPSLWKDISPEAKAAGHGGMDYFVYRAFIDAVINKTDMPIDVYDAATWSAVTALSEQSIATGGEPQYMPDFTHGAWLTAKPRDVVEI